MSTLESYFKGEKGLFKGLAIDGLENDRMEYPVFRFDFSPANYVDTSRLRDRINGCLDSISRDY